MSRYHCALRSPTYDNKGNRTSQTDNLSGAESRTYSYNQANELRLLNGVWQYKYNGDGLRISKYNTQGGPPPPMPGNGTPIPSATPKLLPGGSGTNGTGQPAVIQVPITYTWDIGVEAAGLPLMLQDNNASYIYGPGGIILETVQGTSPGTPYYYHIDQLGSVRAVTNSSGSTLDSYSYDPYGKITNSSVSVSQPFGYAGEFTDSESGLLYLRARYYDPSTQQFLTVDPLLAWTEQGYTYAGGSPTNFVDPLGLRPLGLGVPSPLTSACVSFECQYVESQATLAEGYRELGHGVVSAVHAVGNYLNYCAYFWATVLSGGDLDPNNITPGKNFEGHYKGFSGDAKLLGKYLGKDYPKYSEDGGAAFLKDLQDMINSGKFRYDGLATYKKGFAPAHIFRTGDTVGKDLTLIVKQDGEYVTLLERGVGMDSPGTLIFQK